MAQARKTPATRTARRRRGESRKKSVAIIYKRDGVTIRHIDMPMDQLPGEIERLNGIMRYVHSLLVPKRLRSRHPILQHVRYVLSQAPAQLGTGLTVEQMTQEIGRLNFVMNYALQELGRIKSAHDTLEQVKFMLRYRQTSKKRGVGWNSFRGDRDIESFQDPEEREPDFDDEGF